MISNDLTLEPSLQAKTIKGQQVTRLRALNSNSGPISFSPNALQIESATINGVSIRSQTNADATLFIPFGPIVRNQILQLVVTYNGSPKRGVTFTPNSVHTNYWACDWMFCNQDQPADRATTTVNLRLPANMKSLSVGQKSGHSSHALDRETHVWRESRPIPAYLVGFAAGSFDVVAQRHKGIDLSYINATGQAQPMEQLFGATPDMIDFFASKAGVPFPSPHYSQLLVDGREAQEQSTYSIIGLETIKPILTEPQEDWVIAHELAHQWWGNLITYAAPQEFWLNEGITVFMTAAWKEHRHGRAAYDREIGIARARWTRAKDAGWDRPLAFSGEYASLGTRRAIQYSKGAVFMDHLRTLLGEEGFWRGLRSYTRANAEKAVVSKDFQDAMERANGRDLQGTFDEWVYKGAN